MLLTGEPIDARTALAWGLVNRVVPPGELDATLKEFTDIILARSREVIRVGKETLYRQLDPNLQAAYDLASETMACNMLLEDAIEGIDAFLGKRSAEWRDR
jgi:enoyl-CoA hydratase/carnithine racemase